MLKISIIIITRNRSLQIKSCVNSILRGLDQPLEIIIVDQGLNSLGKFFKNTETEVRYFYRPGKGKSLGLNYAINKAGGKILVFTDDDCVVSKYWLRNIEESFFQNKDIDGVFGKVLPYKPLENKDKICPCTFLSDTKKIISEPVLHSKYIGFGNNMAFRKKVFLENGGFKEWLGPGSIGSNAEDAEFALRLLTKGYRILYNPEVKIYHNRWLTKEEFGKQHLSYSCGEMACYGYLALKGLKLGRYIVKKSLLESFENLSKGSKRANLLEIMYQIRGILVAFWFFIYDLLVSYKDQ